jgi:hypothetical protein
VVGSCGVVERTVDETADVRHEADQGQLDDSDAPRQIDPASATEAEYAAALVRVMRGVRLKAQRSQPAAKRSIPREVPAYVSANVYPSALRGYGAT